MHELGIVFYIIRRVEDVAREHGVRGVSAVTIQLGEVSGVIPNYLQDAWRWAADKHELTQGAELIVEELPAITLCEACGARYGTVEHGRICPACGSERTVLVSGQEVLIKEIAVPDEKPEMEHEPAEAATRAETGASTPPAPSRGPARPREDDPYVRAENEDDDGYDPYSDRRPEPEPLFERDPWR